MDVVNSLENETNPITFSCQAVGEPVPNISWYFSGEMIDVSNASKYIISNSSNGTMVISSLKIMNTQSSDVGRYTCVAKNIIGSDQSSGVLKVNGKQTCLLYCKQYKLSERKVLQFITFYLNIGKTVVALLFTRLKTAFCINISTQNVNYKINMEMFAVCTESAGTAKVFYLLACIIYSLSILS